jgi:hypothetical protein
MESKILCGPLTETSSSIPLSQVKLNILESVLLRSLQDRPLLRLLTILNPLSSFSTLKVITWL